VLSIYEAAGNTSDLEYETVVEFTCNTGFILAHGSTQEDMIVTCLHTAQWDKVVPDCRGGCRRRALFYLYNALIIHDHFIFCSVVFYCVTLHCDALYSDAEILYYAILYNVVGV